MKIYKTLDNGIQIVEYDDSLAAAVADMWNKSGDSWGGSAVIDTADSIRRSISGGSYLNVYLAILNGEVLGYCSFSRYYRDANTLYIQSLNVRPDYHGKKIGKELVLICVLRTIELGYPRLDLHTWPGNTKAVPLYKKCGFFWEDRADSTHLANFIPTVLSTELIKGFFDNASWYDDSVRPIEVKPDGEKINKFDMYEYQWEKDGETLKAGFERTGRRMRLIETNDFKISMTAENHELAFGLDYKCTFEVINKTGKPLNISIKGKDDGVIKFDCEYSSNVENTVIIEKPFSVSEITEEFDIGRVHPCVLADIWVNGLHAEMGVGIEPKFPLSAAIPDQDQIVMCGALRELYINIKSALLQDASIEFDMPKSKLLKFADGVHKTTVKASANASVCVKADVLGYGYDKMPVTFRITMADGRKIEFTKPLHFTSFGFSEAFEFETNTSRGIVNGMWILFIGKKNNSAVVKRVASNTRMTSYYIPKLGKPYDDEFNIAEPTRVDFYSAGNDMVAEVEFLSKKYTGVLVTEIYTLSPAGVSSRRLKITNSSNKPVNLSVKDDYGVFCENNTFFNYNGVISENQDGNDYSFSDIEMDKFRENWVFDEREECPSGIYWSPEYKPTFPWGGSVYFEIETGELKPGETFESKPIVSMHGVFAKYNDFRNYVLGVKNRELPATQNHAEVIFNGYSPFMSSLKTDLTVKNNRSRVLEGDILVSSPDGLFETAKQSNPAAEVRENNNFVIELSKNPSGGIGFAEIMLDLASIKKTYVKPFFSADKTRKVETVEKDGVFTVSNGIISFKAAPTYSEAVFSLTESRSGNEWLASKYPNHEPYSWFNPFIGGITSLLDMRASDVLKEKITAEFTEAKDSFSNLWAGIRTKVDVINFDKFRGFSYEQYFLTMPGIPVLCCFARITNNSGLSEPINISQTAYFEGGGTIREIFCDLVAKDNREYCLHTGIQGNWKTFVKTARVKSNRAEKLYLFKDSARDNGENFIGGDNKVASFDSSAKAFIKNNDSYTTRPLFIIVTDKDLPLDSLNDLERITF